MSCEQQFISTVMLFVEEKVLRLKTYELRLSDGRELRGLYNPTVTKGGEVLVYTDLPEIYLEVVADGETVVGKLLFSTNDKHAVNCEVSRDLVGIRNVMDYLPDNTSLRDRLRVLLRGVI